MNTTQVLIDPDIMALPETAAVFAIFSSSICRFVGETENLKHAMMDLQKPDLPNIPLRHLMLSNKVKILQYLLLEGSTKTFRIVRKEEWISIYEPSDSLHSLSKSNNLSQIAG